MTKSDHILIVDDSPTTRQLMAVILEQDGFEVRCVESAPDALAAIEAETPLLVITDLEMPVMSGLDLVQILRGIKPSLPVVMATAMGNEDVAADALRLGAASYVPKRFIHETLTAVVRQVLSATELIRSTQMVGRYATRSTIELKIGNDETLAAKVISRLEMTLIELDLFDDGGRMQVAMALDEAILNAIVHGNLEVQSSLREIDGGKPYFELIAQRKSESPYKDRQVTVSLEADNGKATFVVRDEGPGFDVASLLSETDHENLEGFGGRGLLMIDAFMNEVRYNAIGNEITMIKNRDSGEAVDDDDSDDPDIEHRDDE
jgi:DNA-binding response OmpR family regulator